MSVSEPQGFLGHEVSLYGRFYDSSNILLGSGHIGTATVGPGIEFGSTAQPGTFSGDFDLDSWSIEIDESKFAGATADAGTFNGYIIEDTNDTLPDFLSATIDESVSTRTSTRILVSPNTIWINDESVTYEANAFLRIQVTFADRRSTSPLTINPSPSGNMLVEAAARVGGGATSSNTRPTWSPLRRLIPSLPQRRRS